MSETAVANVTWIVRKRGFKYNGERLDVGDEWQPSGSRLDEKIVEQGWVYSPTATDPEQKQRASRIERAQKRKQRTNGTRKSQDVVEGRDAQAFRLYYDEGMTMEEVGEELDVAASTVSRAIKRHESRLEASSDED